MTVAYQFAKLCVAVLALAPFLGFAESSSDKEYFYNLPLNELGKVEITAATGNSTPLERAPATATVITAHEIQAMGAKTLDEVLEAVPGLHVSLSSLSRLDSVYSIRGIHTGFNPHVLLLMNGVPVQYSVQGGRPILFKYPTHSIARVEVIRGPGSAIYGADAYSGVINVITKDASHIKQGGVSLRRGSFGEIGVWTQGKTSFNDWTFAYDLSYERGDGDDSRKVEADLQTLFDRGFGTEASLAPGPISTRYEIINTRLSARSKHWSVNAWAWNSEDSGLGAGAAQALDRVGGDDNKLVLLDSLFNSGEMFEYWDLGVRVAYQYYKTEAQLNLLPQGSVVLIGSDGNVDFDTPGNPVQFPDGLIGNPQAVTEDSQIDLISNYTGWESHRFRFAVGAKHQGLDTSENKNFGPGIIDGSEAVVDGTLTDVSNTPFVFIEDTSRTIQYVSLQDEWRFSPDWEATIGVRFDDYSDFGHTTNPRLALVWEAHNNITSKILYGSAFRAPSFSEQFNENNPVSLGNSDLQPEKIDTFEISINAKIGENLQSTFSIYHYDAKGMIEFVADAGTTTSTAQNARDQDGRGVEWDVVWNATNDLRIKANYSLSRAEDKKFSKAIPDYPNKQFTGQALWVIEDKWYMSGLINWVADRKRAQGDSRDSIDNYTSLDLTLIRKDIVNNFDVSVSIRNLLDDDNREPSGDVIADDYPLASRGGWVEIVYSF
ncbi:MAG: TonB-dependent receptor [Agarilytica sp.]